MLARITGRWRIRERFDRLPAGLRRLYARRRKISPDWTLWLRHIHFYITRKICRLPRTDAEGEQPCLDTTYRRSPKAEWVNLW